MLLLISCLSLDGQRVLSLSRFIARVYRQAAPCQVEYITFLFLPAVKPSRSSTYTLSSVICQKNPKQPL